MLQWADTFNRYGTNAALLLNGIYAANNNITLVADPDLTSTQTVARLDLTSSITDTLRFPFPAGAAVTMGVAFDMWLDTLPQNSNTYVAFSFSDIANGPQVGFRVLSTGAVEIVTGMDATTASGGTVLYTTAIPILTPNAWNHVETKAKVDNTTGTYDLRVNGASKVSISGVDTQATANNTSAQCWWKNWRNSGAIGNSPKTYIKNFSVWDTTGTYNNNFLGTVQMTDIDTNADTSLTWTPSTGTVGWSILDNNPPVDTIYVSAATALSNTFALGNLPADATSVKALVLINRSWKIDGGDGNTQMGIISVASTGLGTDRPITTAPTYWKDVIEVDPATGIPFTPTGFNAASLKQSRTV